jgi:hypothetical protein
LNWVVAHVDAPAGHRLRVASCNAGDALAYYLQRSTRAAALMRATDDADRADILLATTRFDRHKTPGRVLHVVERQGAALLYIIARWPRARLVWSGVLS